MRIVYAFRYIKLYGLKFSKEDHIKFIKLLLALIQIPNLEPAKLNKFCIVLSQLLRCVSKGESSSKYRNKLDFIF